MRNTFPSVLRRFHLASAITVHSLIILYCPIPAQASNATPTTVMKNDLDTTGAGLINPAFGRQVKNLMITQMGGWSGLPGEEDRGAKDPTWPLPGGRSSYLGKDKSTYIRQMKEIRELNMDTAVAALIMPDEEATASGYRICWGGASADGVSCTGRWIENRSAFADFKYAAWYAGVETAPLFSINNYDSPGNGERVLPKLKTLVDWYRTTVDATTLRAVDGRLVILIEGLPENTSMDSRQRAELIDYLLQQDDVVWLDNLANPETPMPGSNIFRSAATFDRSGQIQADLAQRWGNQYRWHYTARYAYFESDLEKEENQIPTDVQLRWLNITSHEPERYPVIISQYNEYAESLIFEPNEREGRRSFDDLRSKLAQQP